MLFNSAAIVAAGLLANFADAAASQAFSWKNVRIGGMNRFKNNYNFDDS